MIEVVFDARLTAIALGLVHDQAGIQSKQVLAWSSIYPSFRLASLSRIGRRNCRPDIEVIDEAAHLVLDQTTLRNLELTSTLAGEFEGSLLASLNGLQDSVNQTTKIHFKF